MLSVTNRYNAGNTALREARQISRKQLCLALADNARHEPALMQLRTDVIRYKHAQRFLFAQPITIETLCEVNRIIGTSAQFGKLRSTQNWIGKSLEEAILLPPPPTLVNELFNNAIAQFNKNPTELSSLQKLYEDMINIHPFSDGNGRTARVLWEVISLRSQRTPITPLLICLGNEKYKNNNIFNSDRKITKETWSEILTWQSNLFEFAKDKLTVIELENLDINTTLLSFINSPIQSVKKNSNSHKAIKELISREIIHLIKSEITNEIYLYCGKVMNIYKEIDSYIAGKI